MSSHIKCIIITHLNGRFHLVNADTHNGTGESFTTGTKAESFLQDDGFTLDPTTNEFTRN